MQAHVTVSIAKAPGALTRVLYGLRRLGVSISHYELDDESPTSRQVRLDVGHGGLALDSVRAALDTLDGVLQVRELRPIDEPQRAHPPNLNAALDARVGASGATTSDHDVERVVSHPRFARAWLAGLPVHDPESTALRITWLMRQPGLADTEPNKRLKFLERCREIVAATSRLPAAAALEHGLPLPRRTRSVLDAAAEMNMYFAAAYARLYQDGAPRLRQRRGARGREVLALTAHRALCHYTECLRLRYAGYRSAPQGIWLRVHRVFASARAAGLLDVGVMDMFGQINLHSNVMHAYKRVLLLGLSNPYQCAPGEIDRVCELADHWGAESQLVPVTVSNGNSRFYVDPEADRPGIAWQQDMQVETATLALRTRRLLRVLEEAHNAAPGETDVRKPTAPEDDRLLLEHLIWSWHGGRDRSLPREAFDGELTMVCGLGATADALGGAIAATVDDGDDAVEPPRWTARLPEEAEPVCHPSVLDDSVTGMHVLVHAQRAGAMRVGDVVALRREGTDGWVVAVVRWTRQLEGGEIDTGLFKLGSGARAVDMAIGPQGAVRAREFAVPALRLPALPAGGRGPSLVTLRAAYRPGAQLELRGAPGGHGRARAGRLLLMTRQAVWFELDDEQ